MLCVVRKVGHLYELFKNILAQLDESLCDIEEYSCESLSIICEHLSIFVNISRALSLQFAASLGIILARFLTHFVLF
jgi:hypothetical protein